LVEQRFRKAWVIGSNPMFGSIFKAVVEGGIARHRQGYGGQADSALP
jgi:hypothetical protein